MLPVLNLIKDVKGWESFSKSQNFSRHNFMSADSTTGADLWEEKHVCSADGRNPCVSFEKSIWEVWEIHVKVMRNRYESYDKSMWKFVRECINSIYNLGFSKGEINVKVSSVFLPWDISKYQTELFIYGGCILKENYLSSHNQESSKVSA